MQIIIINIIHTIAAIYIILIIIRALVTWIKPQILFAYNSFFSFVSSLTDPFLMIIRRFIPVIYSGFDFSPVVAILIVEILKNLLIFTITKIF
jgi:YggT family protein